MPRTRGSAMSNVKNAFLPAENSAESAAALGARCIAVLIEERARARLPLDVGAEALAAVVEATNYALQARERFLSAHSMLAKIAVDLGAPMSYGVDECPNSASLFSDLTADGTLVSLRAAA